MTFGHALRNETTERGIAIVVVCVMLVFAALASGTGIAGAMARQEPEPGHTFGEPTAPIAERHVYDVANVLDDAEIVTIESDADRLQRFGIPAVIVTVKSDMAPEEAAGVAASVRQDWDVATAPGADDGLVFLIVLPTTDEGEAYATLSWGVNALPHEGLTATISEQIYQQWISNWLVEPQVFEAVIYGLRRMIYHVIYDPAPPAGLSGAQETARTIVAWLSPLLVIGAALMQSPRIGAALPRFSSLGSGWTEELVPFLLSLLLGVASVWAHSSIGLICTGLVLAIAMMGWIGRDPMHVAPPVPVRERA